MKKALLITLCLLAFGVVSPAQVNPLAEISQNPGWCTIFHRWGFIGDSLCSGEHEYVRPDGNNGYNDVFDYSWGQRIVAAVGGAAGDNYSQGGETAKGWIDHFWDSPCNRNADIDAKVNLKQAYIMALGVNDSHSGIPAGDVKKDVDFKDYTKNAATFIGYYCGIIQRVRSLQPKSRFFIVTMPDDYGNETFNEELRKLPDYFDNLYVLDIAKYGPSYKDPAFKARYFTMGHMNAAGYQFTAWMFMTYINWIVENNIKDFADIAFVR